MQTCAPCSPCTGSLPPALPQSCCLPCSACGPSVSLCSCLLRCTHHAALHVQLTSTAAAVLLHCLDSSACVPSACLRSWVSWRCACRREPHVQCREHGGPGHGGHLRQPVRRHPHLVGQLHEDVCAVADAGGPTALVGAGTDWSTWCCQPSTRCGPDPARPGCAGARGAGLEPCVCWERVTGGPNLACPNRPWERLPAA